MWTNQQGQTVSDNDQYTSPDGTTYPSNFPKGEIPGLTYAPPVVPLPPTIPQMEAIIITATQVWLDSFARTRNYYNLESACTYATSTDPQFQKEGQYCVGVRDTTWRALYTVLASIEARTTPMPTGFADIQHVLPTLTWPA